MNKKGKKIIAIINIILACCMFAVAYIDKVEEDKLKEERLLKEQNEKLTEEIKSHYNKYVKTTRETVLYELKDDKYIEAGKIGKDVEITLKEEEISHKTTHFLIDKLNLYINYKDVLKIDNLTPKNKIYENYLPFNENVVTKTNTIFYNDKGLVYELNQTIDLPIIIKDEDKYYIEFNDELLYVKKKEVDVKDSKNAKEKSRTKIRTLTYHTIYDKKTEECTNTVICHPIEQFDSHMKYLSENNYFTLRMEDLELFLDEKIRIPQKSIVVTLDDGKYAQNAVGIVEKYKVNATYFIITSRYDVSSIKTTYMNFESHTHDMHNNWKCKGGNQGGQLLCEEKNKLIEDLKMSQNKLGGATALAYPFFDFNERAITLLKETGFKLAFVGQYNTDGFSSKGTNKYKVPRKTIFSSDSLEKFISYLK